MGLPGVGATPDVVLHPFSRSNIAFGPLGGSFEEPESGGVGRYEMGTSLFSDLVALWDVDAVASGADHATYSLPFARLEASTLPMP